jgi:hypothetical protein
MIIVSLSLVDFWKKSDWKNVMGSFGGHAVLGSFFIFAGVWWLIKMLRRYFSCQNNNSIFVSSATFTMKGFPIEPTFKFIFVSIGLVLEVGISENVSHSTMYFFYGLTGIVDLMIFFNFKLPEDLDYVSLCVAVMAECILFKFHFFGHHEGMILMVHTLLYYILVTTFVVLILEMKFKTNIVISLLRPFIFILQGPWFYQIGFILHNPFGNSWDPQNYRSLMNTATAFTWHCGAIFVIMLIAFSITGWLYKRKNSDSCKYTPLQNGIVDTEMEQLHNHTCVFACKVYCDFPFLNTLWRQDIHCGKNIALFYNYVNF